MAELKKKAKYIALIRFRKMNMSKYAYMNSVTQINCFTN